MSPSISHKWHILPGAIDDLVRAVLADLPDLAEPDTPTLTASAAVSLPATS